MATRRNSRNALAWQAAVILLPVIALAALGAFYLRQDRLLVRHEAEERARALAGQITAQLWQRLTNSAAISNEYAFRLDESGGLVFPLPYEKAPSPRPLDVSKLMRDDHRAFWGQRHAAGFWDVLKSGMPTEFQAVASYHCALKLAAESRLAEAYEAFRTIYEKMPRALGEAGLPVGLMAGLKALQLPAATSRTNWARPLSWDILCGLAIIEPSALSPMIFEQAERARALPPNRVREHRQRWEKHEVLRDLYRASREQLSSPGAAPIFWIRAAGDKWLASRVEQESTNWIVCRLNNAAGLAADLLQGVAATPNYLGFGLMAANEPVIAAPNAPVLATATHAENGRELLKVSLHLTRPELLYARQRQRVLWFGLLIAVSSVAAIIGLISAWRSFEKQQRLAELKDNFVSSVSHELRAPIASVRLMAEGLERGRVQDPQKQHEYHHFIVQECQRLSALIQNVLDFSRIDQGRKQYEFESADVVRLVDETVKAMEPSAHERQIQLGFSPPSLAITAVIDARAIQQALVNLIDNALKHSPAGSEVAVSVATRNGAPQSVFEIAVEDRGEGIPKSEHERIFERFYRVGSELRRQTPGAGIGLSIVKHIVDAHGGRVRVESEPGKGSRFTIEIPLKG